MKILILSNLWPHSGHTTRAANIVIYKLAEEFSRNSETFFLKISKYDDSKELSLEEKQGVESLRDSGIKVLEPILLPQNPQKRSKCKRVFNPNAEDFYPESVHYKIVEEKIKQINPDVVFIPWSEWITALCSNIDIVKFAYYGNPDPKAALLRLKFSYSHGDTGKMKFLALKRMIKKLEKIHLELMKKYQFLGDVAKNDADYYISKGHPNAFYIQNLWIDRFGELWKEEREKLEKEEPIVIIANIGKVNSTSNQYGLEILGEEILPGLKKKMTRPYEVHIIGSGEFHKDIKKLLERPEVKLRGFVDDIDKEILSSNIFLCLNNASDYKVGHTRYLHAWSLGACIIAHKDSSLSMPEIIHNKNSLLGSSSSEIIDLIKIASENKSLRIKLGQGGYQTFKEFFIAQKVVPKIIEKINNYFLNKINE